MTAMNPRVTPLREPPKSAQIPPFNEEAEQALLGGLLLDNRAYGEVSGILTADDFGRAVHGRIFAAIGKLIIAGQPADPRVLKSHFDSDEALQPIGGGKYLFELARSAVTIINAPYYAEAIADCARRRRLMALAEELADAAADVERDSNAADISARFRNRLSEIQSSAESTDPLIYASPRARTIGEIKPRRWAYGRFLLFGEAGVIGAVDGGGKSAMAVTIALAMITGRHLLSEQVWRTGPVAILSFEDAEDEWVRRIAAACLHYGIDFETVIGSFRFIGRQSRRVTLAARGPNGAIVHPDSDEIIAQLQADDAALLIIDPFNQAHQTDDGNNNAAIAQVAGEATRIAQTSGAALLVLHHLRKGAAGVADDLMGATALRATFRSARILARMIDKEAEAFGIDPRQSWRHVKIAATKENYAPPPELASWFRLEGVALNNSDDLYPNGDHVQVMTAWKPPSAFAGLALDTVAAIFSAIRSGPGDPEFFSSDPRSKRWLGTVITRHGGKTPEEAGTIIRTWKRNGVLIADEYQSPERRKAVPRLTLNEVKAA
jgi:hypothetical protein